VPLLNAKSSFVFVPCGHARFCRSCANRPPEVSLHCPICRAPTLNIDYWTTLRDQPIFGILLNTTSFCFILSIIFVTYSHFPWLPGVLAFIVYSHTPYFFALLAFSRNPYEVFRLNLKRSDSIKRRLLSRACLATPVPGKLTLFIYTKKISH
jgi:hypothetical protein